MSFPETPDWAKVLRVFAMAVDRMKDGAAEYGEYDPKVDARCMYREAQEEILDAVNYLGMQWVKLETMRSNYAENWQRGGQQST